MSRFPSQNHFRATHGGFPIVAQRVFKCLECQQYVVYPSSISQAPVSSCSIPAAEMPSSNVETSDQSDLSQQPFSYDVYPFQLSTLDHSAILPSDLPDSVSFFPSNISQIPFPQVIDVPMTDSCLDSSNSSYLPETDSQRHTTALLRMEIDQLRDMVHRLQERYRHSIVVVPLNRSADSLHSSDTYDKVLT
jgi:hypothetical protein